MNNELGFKELYEISLKSTLPIEISGKTIEAGETIAYFDKILLANFSEIKNSVSARGGWDNRALVTWESTKEIKISFSQGIFSKTQLALMAHANLIQNEGESIIVINKREVFESDENGKIFFNKEITRPIFIYNETSGEKITDWTLLDNTITLTQPYQQVVVDYNYKYNNGYTTLSIGRALTRGYLSLEGKMKIKDDVTGQVKTGIIKIPKLRLMSDLSMRVGRDAIPQVGHFDAVADPEGARGQTKIMEIVFLNDDIDADM